MVIFHSYVNVYQRLKATSIPPRSAATKMTEKGQGGPMGGVVEYNTSCPGRGGYSRIQ